MPTTRALASVTTGEWVQRETALPGAVLTRVAASHLRVGTFQYFAARGDTEGVRMLPDYAIAWHYPDAAQARQPTGRCWPRHYCRFWCRRQRAKRPHCQRRTKRLQPSSRSLRQPTAQACAASLGSLRSARDAALAEDLLERMATNCADFTLTFRRLCDAAAGPEGDAGVRTLFVDPGAFDGWAAGGRRRLKEESADGQARAAAMRRVNPTFIPRKHLVETALEAASRRQVFRCSRSCWRLSRGPMRTGRGLRATQRPPVPRSVCCRLSLGPEVLDGVVDSALRSLSHGRLSGPILSQSPHAFSRGTLAWYEQTCIGAPLRSANLTVSFFGQDFPNENGIHCLCSVTSSKRPARKRASSGAGESPFRWRHGRPLRSPARRVRSRPLNLRRTCQPSDCESTQR